VKTTKKQFEQFIKGCDHWLNFFGLKQWKVYYRFADMNKDDIANVAWKISGRVATMSLNKDVPDFITTNDIKMSAFHEVCELLFANISTCLGDYISEIIVNDMVHEVIRILENTVFKRKD